MQRKRLMMNPRLYRAHSVKGQSVSASSLGMISLAERVLSSWTNPRPESRWSKLNYGRL